MKEIILFDYGNTLIYEDIFDGYSGGKAIYKYLKQNKTNISENDFSKELLFLYSKAKEYRDMQIEVSFISMLEQLKKKYNLEFSISDLDIEKIYWDNSGKPRVVDGAIELLLYLKNKGYRVGVISNISFSSINLRKRLEESFCCIDFEIVVSSSDVKVRKPSKKIFSLALNKEWKALCFIGDEYNTDIIGALNANIKPVWITKEKISNIECVKDLSAIKRLF